MQIIINTSMNEHIMLNQYQLSVSSNARQHERLERDRNCQMNKHYNYQVWYHFAMPIFRPLVGLTGFAMFFSCWLFWPEGSFLSLPLDALGGILLFVSSASKIQRLKDNSIDIFDSTLIKTLLDKYRKSNLWKLLIVKSFLLGLTFTFFPFWHIY